MNMISGKRFIAGAVCPQCKLMDKTVIHRTVEKEYTECVRCGYQMQQPLPATGEKKLKSIPINVTQKEHSDNY